MNYDNIFKRYTEFIDFEQKDIENRLEGLPKIIGYYQSFYFSIKKKHTSLNFELDKKWQERFLYYKNDFNFSLTNQEIKSFIEKDLEYLDLRKSIKEVNSLLERLELTLKNLDNMRWTIKSLIEWVSFINGSIK